MLRKVDQLLTAEEFRLRNRKRRIMFSLLLVLVLLLVLGFFFARPTMHAIKAFQARRHARAAFAFIAQEKWSNARDEATAAYQLYAAEPEAIRAVARFLTRVRDSQALDFWQQLRERTPLTRQDLRDEAGAALNAGETHRATGAIKQLVADAKIAAPTDWLLSAQLALQNSAAADALDATKKVFSDPRVTEPERLQAALLEVAGCKSFRHRFARATSDGRVVSPNEFGKGQEQNRARCSDPSRATITWRDARCRIRRSDVGRRSGAGNRKSSSGKGPAQTRCARFANARQSFPKGCDRPTRDRAMEKQRSAVARHFGDMAERTQRT